MSYALARFLCIVDLCILWSTRHLLLAGTVGISGLAEFLILKTNTENHIFLNCCSYSCNRRRADSATKVNTGPW